MHQVQARCGLHDRNATILFTNSSYIAKELRGVAEHEHSPAGLQLAVVEGLRRARAAETVEACENFEFTVEGLRESCVEVFSLEAEAPRRVVENAVRKLHVSLAHPSVPDLVRI